RDARRNGWHRDQRGLVRSARAPVHDRGEFPALTVPAERLARGGRMFSSVAVLVRITAGVVPLAFGLPDGASAQSSGDAPYLAQDAVDVLRLLAPPPFRDDALARDLAAVRALQEERSAERYRQALDDAAVSVFRFADVLGPAFAAENVPITARLFDRVNRDIG